MEMSANDFMPILFKVLFGFISLNLLVSLILLGIKKKRMYQLLALFWATNLIMFIFQAYFQEGNSRVAFAYSATMFPVTISAMIGFEAIRKKFPLVHYIVLFALAFPLTYILAQKNASFTVVAMPFSILFACMLGHTSLQILVLDKDRTTRLQKVLGIVYFLQGLHSINFALFRMDSGSQLWGWLVSYAVFDALAILLPSIALEEANMHENEKLQSLVNERTSELNKSLKENEGLLKVLLHDISNPLMVMKYYLTIFRPVSPEEQSVLSKMQMSQSALESIMKQVKDIYGQNSKKGRIPLKPVVLEDCFNEVSFIFAQSLEQKKVSLKFNNLLKPNTCVMADKTSLTHSVLSNLVSNGLKFSSPNSEIEITAKEEANSVIVEVSDKGPGISKEVIQSLMKYEGLISTEGTSGEKGSGFGLSIVKSFVDSYGGQIEIDSRYMFTNPQNHGTSVRITLDRA